MLTEYVCDSAGVSALEGNPALKDAIKTAKQMSVDISAHRSKPITEALLAGSHLVFVMEKNHKNQIEVSFPQHRNKIRLLSDCLVGEKGGFDILDPVGHKGETYEAVYREISRSIMGLAEILEHEEGF
jgi:protein-tyrosine phosphatase